MVVMVMTSPKVTEDGLGEEEEVDSTDYEETLPEIRFNMNTTLSFVVMGAVIMAVQPECLKHQKTFSLALANVQNSPSD